MGLRKQAPRRYLGMQATSRARQLSDTTTASSQPENSARAMLLLTQQIVLGVLAPKKSGRVGAPAWQATRGEARGHPTLVHGCHPMPNESDTVGRRGSPAQKQLPPLGQENVQGVRPQCEGPGATGGSG